MTIVEVAEMLDDCANKNCNYCKYIKCKDDCESRLLQEMANECRLIAEELEEDEF